MPEAISSTTMSPIKASSTIIRLATLDEVSQIAVLGASVFAATFGYSIPPSDLSAFLTTTYSTSAMTADLVNPSITTYVAVSSNSPSTVLGFTQLTRGTTDPCLEGLPKTVELQRLYVSTEAHGLGLGGKLVKRAMDTARDEGWETLWLGAWEKNVKAHGFYGKVGFERCGVHGFTIGTCVQTDWIMKMAL